MAVITMRQLLEAGVHFGHQTRRWNPKMRRFIFGERNGIYIIDLEQTLSRVDKAYGFVRDLVAGGGVLMFVGTKKQAQDPVRSFAEKCGMPYVNERWLGGMLTNFDTIAKRINKMLEYERMQRSGEFEAMPKKEALLLTRELEKLQRNLGGLREMTRRPDAIFVLDTKKESIAVTEANKLGHPRRGRRRHQRRPRARAVPDPRQRRRDPRQLAARPGDRRRRRGGSVHRRQAGAVGATVSAHRRAGGRVQRPAGNGSSRGRGGASRSRPSSRDAIRSGVGRVRRGRRGGERCSCSRDHRDRRRCRRGRRVEASSRCESAERRRTLSWRRKPPTSNPRSNRSNRYEPEVESVEPEVEPVDAVSDAPAEPNDDDTPKTETES